MGELQQELRQVRPSPLRPGEEWLISYDNAGAHNAAAKDVPGLNKLPLPAKSPDMHKVVEHVHGWLTQKMQLWLLQRGATKVTPPDAWAELERLFKSYPTESVAKDVASLPETYQAIIDAGGAYPLKRFR